MIDLIVLGGVLTAQWFWGKGGLLGMVEGLWWLNIGIFGKWWETGNNINTKI